MLRKILRDLKRLALKRPCPEVINVVRSKALTYLNEEALYDLYYRIKELEESDKVGILIEAGCALGGSAIVIATAKTPSRKLYVYDVFGMIPPPSAKDGVDVHERYQEIESGRSKGLGDGKYYGYEENLLDKVFDSFRDHGIPIESNNINLVKGLFQDTIIINDPVLLAHIDGDWYDSVMVCLTRIAPHLVRGGILVIDDYEAWSGCRRAVDEYFEDKRSEYEFIFNSRLHIIRK